MTRRSHAFRTETVSSQSGQNVPAKIQDCTVLGVLNTVRTVWLYRYGTAWATVWAFGGLFDRCFNSVHRIVPFKERSHLKWLIGEVTHHDAARVAIFRVRRGRHGSFGVRAL